MTFGNKATSDIFAPEQVVKELTRAEVAEWLRQEARGTVTPHVRRVLLRLAKDVLTKEFA